jgi:hypothetical protein
LAGKACNNLCKCREIIGDLPHELAKTRQTIAQSLRARDWQIAQFLRSSSAQFEELACFAGRLSPFT